MSNIEWAIEEKRSVAERAISEFLAGDKGCLKEQIEYAVGDGGKRVRPTLMLLAAKAFGADDEKVMPYALALELIHSYSLVHDDMPEMDNDDMRRGKPSVHARFGQGVALLTGDVLFSKAMEVASEGGSNEALKILSGAAVDMVEGQAMELGLMGKKASRDEVYAIYKLKTAALFRCAISLPYVLAESNKKPSFPLEELTEVAEEVGIIFQIVDDFLDMESGEDEDKPTFINVCGKDFARIYLEQLCIDVKGFFADYDLKDTPLYGYIERLTTRVK